jgi:hypothetical protein
METALFVGVNRLIFALAITLMFLPCLLGRFAFLTEILSAKTWYVFSRLSYGVYLTHVVIMGVVVLNYESSFFWSS